MSLINQVLQDLEKRHASESELNSLPPHVRAVPGRPQSSMRMVLLGGVVLAVVLAAIVFWYYGSRPAPVGDAPQILSKPIEGPAAEKPAALVPAPIPEQKQPVVPVPDTSAQSAASNPVFRLSGELSYFTPSPARKDRPSASTQNAKSVAAIPSSPAAPTPSPQVEKPQPQVAAEAPPRAEVIAKPTAPAGERAASPVPIPATDAASGAIDKQMRDVAPSERAEIVFRRGVTQLQEGRANAAELDFREALKLDPTHNSARQALLGLLLDSGRNADAEQLLRKTLEANPRQPRHAMVLARLEVERGEVTGAINTMVGVLPYVQTDPDFHAFLAALLQREGRHREAADYYRTALRGVPGNGVWAMGLGISLRASNQSAEARDAFQRAIDSRQLSPELTEFVERQLRELSAPKKK